jgi:hypothetical protein
LKPGSAGLFIFRIDDRRASDWHLPRCTLTPLVDGLLSRCTALHESRSLSVTPRKLSAKSWMEFPRKKNCGPGTT